MVAYLVAWTVDEKVSMSVVSMVGTLAELMVACLAVSMVAYLVGWLVASKERTSVVSWAVS